MTKTAVQRRTGKRGAGAKPRRARAGARTRVATAPPDADTTRDKILVTALQVFAEHGFDGARTRDIAERAGANLGLIAYYFDNKETLWREAVTRAFTELQADLAPVVTASGEADVRAQLEQLARRFVRFVARKPEFMRLMNDEGKRDSARMRWLVDRFVQPMHQGLRVLIERAQARGLVPAIAPASLHYIMLGATGLLFSQAPECRRIMGVDPSDDAFVEAHADAVIRILLNG
jgi:TetR/AcrR family transcriptional regulator